MTKLRFLIFGTILLGISACSVQINQTNSNNSSNKIENIQTPKTEPTKDLTANSLTPSPFTEKKESSADSSCAKLTRDDLMIDKKQTFPIDFKPFAGACFVTFHDPEFDKPPLGAQFYIYKNGKEVFNFPEQFGGANTTCWVDGVAFEDLNNDQLKDIIVVGKCGGKMSDYNENMVYINTGTEFITNPGSNAETMDFSKVGQIKEFVKKNPEMFSK